MNYWLSASSWIRLRRVWWQAPQFSTDGLCLEESLDTILYLWVEGPLGQTLSPSFQETYCWLHSGLLPVSNVAWWTSRSHNGTLVTCWEEIAILLYNVCFDLWLECKASFSPAWKIGKIYLWLFLDTSPNQLIVLKESFFLLVSKYL